MDVIHILEVLTQFLVAVILLFQIILVYILPPDQADKYNFVGRALDFLSKTKKGLSFKGDDVANTKSNNNTRSSS